MGFMEDQKEASLRSERGLPRESGLVLCSPECPSGGLTSLDLSGCSELADGTLLAISRDLGHLQCLRLRKLQWLMDAGCTALGGLRELHSLDLAECCLVSGRGLAQALGSGHRAPAPLASFSLAYCSSLKLHQELEHQASGPKDLSPHPQGPSLLMLRALWELELTACSKLMPVLQFPELRQLSLSLLPALTDQGSVAVARGCPSLERLVLSHCSVLSDEGWAQAAALQPGQLRAAHRAVSCPMMPRSGGWAGSPCRLALIGGLPQNSGYHQAGMQAAPDVRCGHMPSYQHGCRQALPSPTAPGDLCPVPLRGRC
ncbi:hypothetical protein GH733_013037 [Mirounga leonina]|nr:hypothetical protein GH733_013037 [Mirounga leonina]